MRSSQHLHRPVTSFSARRYAVTPTRRNVPYRAWFFFPALNRTFSRTASIFLPSRSPRRIRSQIKSLGRLHELWSQSCSCKHRFHFVRLTFLQGALDALSKAEASRTACRNTLIDRQNANGVMPRTTLPKHLEARTSPQKAQGRPKQFRFSISYFLGALILNILISPFTDPLRSGDLIETMLMTSVLLVAVLSIAGRWRALVGIVLAAPAVIGEWLYHWWPD
jgi:hypothetical protein